MNVEDRNKRVIVYINAIKEIFSNNNISFNEDFFDKKLNELLSSTKTFDEIKKEIDTLVQKKLEDLKTFQEKHESNEKNTLQEIKNAKEIADSVIAETDVHVFLTGGILPYILLDEESNRLHDDIDTVCMLQDMDKLRDAFQAAGLYNPELDSLTYTQDGNDYGFEVEINGILYGMHPFTYENGEVLQRSYNSSNKMCTIKSISVNELSDYIISYQGKDGKTYDAMTLEVLKKRKEEVARDKDIEDIQAINRIGTRDEVDERIGNIAVIQSAPATVLGTETLEQEGPRLVRKLKETQSSNTGDNGKINLFIVLLVASLILIVTILLILF